eukprot:77801-Rhodomonas_salina.2
MSQAPALAQCLLQPPRSLWTDLVLAQVKMSQRLTRSQQPQQWCSPTACQPQPGPGAAAQAEPEPESGLSLSLSLSLQLRGERPSRRTVQVLLSLNVTDPTRRH